MSPPVLIRAFTLFISSQSYAEAGEHPAVVCFRFAPCFVFLLDILQPKADS